MNRDDQLVNAVGETGVAGEAERDEGDPELPERVALLEGLPLPERLGATPVDERERFVSPAGRAELVERLDDPRAAKVDA